MAHGCITCAAPAAKRLLIMCLLLSDRLWRGLEAAGHGVFGGATGEWCDWQLDAEAAADADAAARRGRGGSHLVGRLLDPQVLSAALRRGHSAGPAPYHSTAERLIQTAPPVRFPKPHPLRQVLNRLKGSLLPRPRGVFFDLISQVTLQPPSALHAPDPAPPRPAEPALHLTAKACFGPARPAQTSRAPLRAGARAFARPPA